MQYTLPKEFDTPSNNTFMLRGITNLKKQGKSEGSAIAICKATLIKMNGDTTKAEIELALTSKDMKYKPF